MDYGRDFLRPLMAKEEKKEKMLPLEGENEPETAQKHSEPVFELQTDREELISPGKEAEQSNFLKMSSEKALEEKQIQAGENREIFDFSEASEESDDGFFDWDSIHEGVKAWESISAQSSTGVEFHRRQSMRASQMGHWETEFTCIYCIFAIRSN